MVFTEVSACFSFQPLCVLLRLIFCLSGNQPAGQLHGGKHAAVVGPALASDFERGTVIGRRADDRQSERDVDAGLKRDQLERNQRLVVVGANDGVEGFLLHGVIKNRVGGQMAQDDFFFPQFCTANKVE